jgi:16S rRNA (cytidine1402-2'-O)-methyltransferase
MKPGVDPGTLYVVATPIGNLEDITVRALRILKQVSLIAAEDTRVTRKLLGRYEINCELQSYREQNSKRAIPLILARLEAGEAVALVSDAGTPAVSDPGVELVEAAVEAGFSVTPIPGPSALAAAVSVAGIPGTGVRFLGFLPRSGKERRNSMAAIAVDPALLVIYESPHRLVKTLTDLSEESGERQAVVAREMTKIHEEIARGRVVDLVEHFKGDVKGEVVIVIAGAGNDSGDELSEERLRELVCDEVAKGRSAKDISTALAGALGLPRKKIYDLVVTEISNS